MIKLHSSLSEKIVEKLESFDDLMGAVRHHHENFDGSGYPDALVGEQIPVMARIISIVDVFDALTTRRIYRDSMSIDQALTIMHDEQNKGKFDPEIFEIFLHHIHKIGVLDQTHLSNLLYPELEERRNSFYFKNSTTNLLNRDGLLAFLRKGSSHAENAFLAEINIRSFSQYNRHISPRTTQCYQRTRRASASKKLPFSQLCGSILSPRYPISNPIELLYAKTALKNFSKTHPSTDPVFLEFALMELGNNLLKHALKGRLWILLSHNTLALRKGHTTLEHYPVAVAITAFFESMTSRIMLNNLRKKREMVLSTTSWVLWRTSAASTRISPKASPIWGYHWVT